ncbi:YfiT family bacillithiol transferase [Alicyclobacillus macrosporangiidus]|uniref:DinB superfamily protein n=1 Tax=Alicyclobacillus macrosporangiidus TaxID=392015 RepID=A0A1I7JYG6_9BACL|nr:putative metal-dependent hydrolase [Alicyclobacillus macrosporangiidus]SFU90216.1 DinB superfamily protein [Alicyclobacillus macrosporangiidus]
MEDLRYPIGMYHPVLEISDEDRNQLIREIEIQPATLRAIVEKLTPEQMETPYRPGGWTIRQVVHHLADNNMNAYIRFKRGLTEDTPSSPPYREDLWAELPDYRQIPVGESLILLEVLHRRFSHLLWALHPEDFRCTLAHSTLGVIRLDTALHRFVWHNRHHIAQISGLCERMGWSC